MKKNAIGRVLAYKESVGTRISKLHIPARILCFLLALIIWLAVTAFTSSEPKNEQPAEQNTVQETA